MQLSGREKATIFLSILGADTSSKVLRYLPGELADMIAKGINHLPTPTPEALSEVLDDFKSYLALPSGKGREAAPEVSVKPQKPREKMTPFEILNAAPAAALSQVLLEERPQIVAFILSRLDDMQAAEVSMALPYEKVMLQNLIKSIKKNPLTPKLEQKLFAYYSKKV